MRGTPRPWTRLLFVALVAAAPAAARAEILILKPPLSLNLVVKKALQNGDAEDVILVYPGTIPEKVVIDYTGTTQTALTIVKAEKNRPVIDGGLEIRNARKVRVEGFRVHSEPNDGVAAIMIRDSAAVTLVDCRGKAQDDGGVDAADSFEVVVERCKFDAMGTWEPNDSGYGVKIIGKCGHVVRDCDIAGNTFRGIWIEADASEVRGCEVRNNGGGPGSSGIYLSGRRNQIRGCDVIGNEGLGVIAAGECTIKKNLIRNNDRAGLRYGEDAGAASSGGAILDNVVRDNGDEGVLVKSFQQAVEIRKNTISGNEGVGLRVAGAGCQVSDNDVRETRDDKGPGHAILVESDGNLFHRNVFKKNAGDAIRVEGSGNYLTENEVQDGKSGFTIGVGDGNLGRDNLTPGKNDFP